MWKSKMKKTIYNFNYYLANWGILGIFVGESGECESGIDNYKVKWREAT